MDKKLLASGGFAPDLTRGPRPQNPDIGSRLQLPASPLANPGSAAAPPNTRPHVFNDLAQFGCNV